jgi:predicted CoA-binding protein
MITDNSIVVLGASPNPKRTSYLAAKVLIQKGYNVYAYGSKTGKIDQLSINDKLPNPVSKSIDAITIFLSPQKQKDYYEYILDTKPKSIIFNPGSENPELEKLAKKNNINIVSCCTIALTAVGFL